MKKLTIALAALFLTAVLMIGYADLYSNSKKSPKKSPMAVSDTGESSKTNSQAADSSEADSVPESNSSQADSLPEMPEPEEGEEVKDVLRAAFGHKTHAQQRREAQQAEYERQAEERRKQEELEHEQFLADLDKTYTLTEGENYSVNRTRGPYEDNITWVITYNGSRVLGRSADNEYSYRYFYGSDTGVYTYHLEALVEGDYRTVSNTITYNIESPVTTEDDPELEDMKDTVKHTLKTMHIIEDDNSEQTYTYRMGYIGDFSHENVVEGLVFMLSEESGTQCIRVISDGALGGALFDNYGKQGLSFGVWYDPATGRDYLTAVEREGESVTVTDAFTGESLDGVITDMSEFYNSLLYPTPEDGIDEDHFYVSRDHEASFEGAY